MAQLIPGRPGIGAAFGTGLASSLNSLAEAKVKQMIEGPQRQAYASALMSILAPEQAQQQQMGLPEMLGAQEAQQGIQSQQPLSQQANISRALSQGGLNEQQLFQLASLAQQQKAQQVTQQKESRKEQIEEQKRIDADTKKYYEDVLAKGDTAKKANKRLEKMKNLIEKGKLPFSTLYNIINSLEEVSPAYGGTAGATAGGLLGGPVGAAIGGAAGALISPVASILRGIQRYTSPDTEEFEKLSADFIKDAKGIFGSRITDADLKAFLKTVPTLSQTDAGKRKIIDNLEVFNKATIAEEEALKEVLKENKGKRPANLQLLVQERTKEKLDEIADQFNA